MKFLYKKFLKPILFLIDPETVHNLFTSIGERLGYSKFGRKLVGSFYKYKKNDISIVVDGLTYKSPVMLSAGFDYNARLTQILPSLSFGGQEAGSVTARPCKGNPKPRLTRLKKNKGLIVYKGLKNEGVEAIITRLKNKKKIADYNLGISIARTNDEKSGDIDEGAEDYYYSLKRLNEENIGDFYTINISCPNAFAGETFGDKPELLDKLLKKLDSLNVTKPIYIKMPINKSWKEFNALLEVIVKHKLSGVVIGNLNKNYDELEYRDEAPQEYRGGLSGAVCKERSNQLIKQTKETYGNKLTIIGVGGILSAEDALEKLRLGADLVQLITGMIFEGPHLIKDICKAYAKTQINLQQQKHT